MTDPSIALQVRPPEQANPLAQAGQVAQLSSLLQQRPLIAEQLRAASLENQQRQQVLDNSAALSEALQSSVVDGPDGQKVPDYDKALQKLYQGGHHQAAASLQQSLFKQREDASKLLETNLKNVRSKIDLGGQLAQAITDDQSYQTALPLFTQLGIKVPPTYNKTTMKQLADSSISHKEFLDQLSKSLSEAPKTAEAWSKELGQTFGAASTAEQASSAYTALHSQGAPVDMLNAVMNAWKTGGKEKARMFGVAPAEQPKTEIENVAAKAIVDAKPEDLLNLVDQVVPPGVKENQALNLRTKALVNAAVARGDIAGAKQAIHDASAEVRQLEVATDPRVKANKIEIAVATDAAKNASEVKKLTDDDYRREGVEYALTGKMPPLGMRSPAVREKIISEKNNWARENGFTPQEVIMMRKAVEGDADSLKKLTAQRDNVVTFENTAKKNLEQFTNLANKLPDTGVPWVNTPLRLLNDKLVGNQWMPAVNAARQVANNEIAKVTSGGGFSTALSDHARQEVKDYNPANATLNQTLNVAKVLLADMSNRHDSLDASLAEIRSRIGSAGTTKPDETGAKKKKTLGDYFIH